MREWEKSPLGPQGCPSLPTVTHRTSAPSFSRSVQTGLGGTQRPRCGQRALVLHLLDLLPPWRCESIFNIQLWMIRFWLLRLLEKWDNIQNILNDFFCEALDRNCGTSYRPWEGFALRRLLIKAHCLQRQESEDGSQWVIKVNWCYCSLYYTIKI